MTAIITIHPDKSFGPPRCVSHADDSHMSSLGASVELIPGVDMLFNRNTAETVSYLRVWARRLTELADQLDAEATEDQRTLAERVYLKPEASS